MMQKFLRFGRGFRVAFGNKRSQAAEMTLATGGTEGGPDNCHRGSDQWMYVVTGRGRAIVGGKSILLKPGKIILIERGTRHEIRCTSRTALKTLNIYVPPAYRADGQELPAGKAR